MHSALLLLHCLLLLDALVNLVQVALVRLVLFFVRSGVLFAFFNLILLLEGMNFLQLSLADPLRSLFQDRLGLRR